MTYSVAQRVIATGDTHTSILQGELGDTAIGLHGPALTGNCDVCDRASSAVWSRESVLAFKLS